MAKAVVSEEIRTLLRAEALKQFDNDTDVLYQKVKNNKLQNGVTLHDYLADLYSSNDKFDKIVDNLPLLTIFIPALDKFSATKWDVKNEIPMVVSYPDKIGDGTNQRNFFAYDQFGKSIRLSKYKQPDFAVILVKDNERLFVQRAGNARLSFGANRLINEGGFSYDFIDASFDARANGSYKARIGRGGDEIDPEVKNAYDYNLQYQRDYIYYGIAPERGINSGSLKNNYSEYITTLSFNIADNFDHVVDDQISDWGDGNLEFVIGIIAIDGKTSLNPINKGFSCPITGLFSYVGDSSKHTVVQVLPYFIPQPIEIFNWDMARYGDTLKFIIYESDPITSGTTTYSTTITSTYGFNFSLGVKDGPSFGFNNSDVDAHTMTTSIVVAGSPDYLYDGVLNWKDKVITERYDLSAGSFYGFNDVETGTVNITVEPRRKY